MAINQNHLFEDLDGAKCAVVEKNVSPERMEFLKDLLEWNGFKVMTVPSPPPKGATEDQSALPATFTVGVTDVTFNATNAIFGRLLKNKNGKVVTLAYWQQESDISEDQKPYFEQ